MTQRRLILAAAAAAAMLAPALALAHHGWGDYDAAKPIKLTSTLSDVAWRMPHGSAKVRYQNRDWDVVLAPVSRMQDRGLTQAMLGPGKAVTLEGYPRRDGVAEMRIERVSVDGKTVELR